jgi:hypothetical protein
MEELGREATMVRQRLLLGVLVLVLTMAMVGCAAGDRMFEHRPAGFWNGLWHGIIFVIAFIVSLFDDSWAVYEAHNTGHLYDLGFVLGILAVTGSASAGSKKKKRKKQEVDWEKVEGKLKGAIRKWLDESEETDPEWREIAEKLEAKLKRELRSWAEEEKE